MSEANGGVGFRGVAWVLSPLSSDVIKALKCPEKNSDVRMAQI